MINSTIKVVKQQTKDFTNLEFHKYWLDNFIIKNKETGEEILKHLKVQDLDNLFKKLKL